MFTLGGAQGVADELYVMGDFVSETADGWMFGLGLAILPSLARAYCAFRSKWSVAAKCDSNGDVTSNRQQSCGISWAVGASCLTSLAYFFAPTILLAPLSLLHFLAIFFFEVGWVTTIGVLGGVAISIVGSPKANQTWNQAQILQVFYRWNSLLCALGLAGAVVVGCITKWALSESVGRDNWRTKHRQAMLLSWGFLPGVIGGICIALVKALFGLMHGIHYTDGWLGVLSSWMVYALGGVLLNMFLLQLSWSNEPSDKRDALISASAFVATETLVTTVIGLVFFGAYRDFTMQGAVLFSAGIVMALTGVCCAVRNNWNSVWQSTLDEQSELIAAAQDYFPSATSSRHEVTARNHYDVLATRPLWHLMLSGAVFIVLVAIVMCYPSNIVTLPSPVLPSAAEGGNFSVAVTVQQKEQNQLWGVDTDVWKTHTAHTSWNTHETAVIVVDMWNGHPCQPMAARVKSMSVPMNELLSQLRQQGVTIVHGPANQMDFYEAQKHPARLRAISMAQQSTKAVHQPPVKPGSTSPINKGCEGSLGPCTITRQTKLISIDKHNDYIVDINNLKEVVHLLQATGKKNILYMGTAANICVLHRPAGAQAMAAQGYRPVVVKDMTISETSSLEAPYVNYDVAHDLQTQFMEKFVCGTTTKHGLETALSLLEQQKGSLDKIKPTNA